MLHMPSPMLLGGADEYQRFKDHIAVLATDGAWGFLTNLASATRAAKAWRVTANGDPYSASIGLYGSSWNSSFALNAGNIARAIQHGLPSQAIFDAQIADGREMFVRLAVVSNRTLTALLRNGYQSEGSDGATETRAVQMTELIFNDGSQTWRMTPNTGGGPTAYSF